MVAQACENISMLDNDGQQLGRLLFGGQVVIRFAQVAGALE